MGLPARRRYARPADPINAITSERMAGDPPNRCARVGDLRSDRCPLAQPRSLRSARPQPNPPRASRRLRIIASSLPMTARRGPFLGQAGAGPAKPALCAHTVWWPERSPAVLEEVSHGELRDRACRSGHRHLGHVRPGDLQGPSLGPLQTRRRPLLLMVPGRGLEGLRPLDQGHHRHDRRARPLPRHLGGTSGDLRRFAPDRPAQRGAGPLHRRA